nr:MAG TPA: hypothetical protein [Caudoviricetes sp.]
MSAVTSSEITTVHGAEVDAKWIYQFPLPLCLCVC